MSWHFPDPSGHFGRYGGRYVPETLMGPLEDLERAYREAQQDPGFQAELDYYLQRYAGRPTPLYLARRLTEKLGGAKIYLKREDLCHTGAHKINNTLGQVLLTCRMGKRRVIAETGAGQHGVATATAAALFGLECQIYMGTEDMQRQALNVFRIRLLGAEVRPVEAGSRTLKDAINEAMRDWVTNVDHTHYVLGSALGPHPFPMMVRDFQSVIGREAREDGDVRMIGVEAGGLGIESGKHAARFAAGEPGVLHGTLSYVLQDENGQIRTTHSVSAGLDYPAVGPEHTYLREIGRAEYVYVRDHEALEGFRLLAGLEGIIPALECAHAIAYATKLAPEMGADSTLLINLSGRGDKDVELVSGLIDASRAAGDKEQVGPFQMGSHEA